MNPLLKKFCPLFLAALALPERASIQAAAFMSTPRVGHTATLLPSGKVLVAGGSDGTNDLTSGEIYDPITEQITTAGHLNVARESHRATLLHNGKVLITGGGNNSGALASTELYDPASETFTLAASLTVPRREHTATLLTNGAVLITGGSTGQTNESSAELYEPASGRFIPTGAMSKTRRAHTATLLANGKVLITGGFNPFIGGGGWSEAELYDPSTGTFSLTAGELVRSRNVNSATLLPDGKVLIVGGSSGFISMIEAELFDPMTGLFTSTSNLNQRRFNETSTLLPNGSVLVAAGIDIRGGAGTLNSTEIYDPASGTFSFGAHLIQPRSGHRATLLNDGQVLFTGGTGFDGKPLASVELYGDISCAGEVAALRVALLEKQGLVAANEKLFETVQGLETILAARESELGDLRTDLKAIINEIETGLGPPKRRLPGRNSSDKLHALAARIKNLPPGQKQLLIKMLKLQ